MSSSARINGHAFPNPCPHLAAFRLRHGANPFRALQACLRVWPPCGRAAVLRDPRELPRCALCGDSARSRLFACLACAAVFCHRPPEASHASSHAASLRSGHEIAVDVDRAELFCCACGDQVYDGDFDAAVVLAQTAASTLGGGSAAIRCSRPENLRKRRRVDYRPWSPDLRERVLTRSCSSPVESVDSSQDLPRGLRGVNNLGNTCFMNSVLQALLHAPPLRNYFLSDRHNRYYCQRKSNAGDVIKKKDNANDGSGSKNARMCLACDMDALYSAVFSGDRVPNSPARFLYSWWQHAANLASYEQQDAHEFFISMLDGIHEKVEKDQRKPVSQGSGDCCIAHRVFSGILRSDVMCTVCGFTSTTYDPCVDISLDLEPNLGGPTKSASSTENMNLSKNGGISTLIGCLDRFTRPERLGSDQKFFCQQCQVRQESFKQMSIRKLPLVSCFHIK